MKNRHTLVLCLLSCSIFSYSLFGQTTADTIYLTACARYFGGDQAPVNNVQMLVHLGDDFSTGQTFAGTSSPDSPCSTVAVPVDIAGDYEHFSISGAYLGPAPALGNGLSVSDIICISQHILGMQVLPSFYAYLAADANNSYSITSFDIVTIRNIIYGEVLPVGGILVYPDYCVNFTPENPLQPPCPTIPIGILDSVAMDTVGLFALKKGDPDGDFAIDGNYQPDTGNAAIAFQLPKWTLSAGPDTIDIPVYTTGFTTINGFQFALQYDSLALKFLAFLPAPGWNGTSVDWTYKIKDGNFYSIVYHIFNDVSQDTIGFLRCVVNQDCYLPDVLTLDPSAMVPMYSLGCGITGPLLVQYDPVSAAYEAGRKTVQISAANPNPYTDHTGIDIRLERSETVLLQVFTIDGKLAYSTESNLPAGRSRLEIPGAVLQHGQMGIYKVQTGVGCFKGKLIRGR